MTEVEEVIAALMLDRAVQADGKKFCGSVSHLRADTEGAYSLHEFVGAFAGGLDFLEANKLAQVHRHPGVEDYVAIDLSSTMGRLLHSSVAGHGTKSSFSIGESKPAYPIIYSHHELGSSWLHDVALTLRQRGSEQNREEAIQSELWTGRRTLSEEDRIRLRDVMQEIRVEFEKADLSNTERANALTALDAADILAEAPDPPWFLILRILESPVLANVTALVALAISIIGS